VHGMVEDGIWLSRKQRRQIHQPRLRRECFGELIQIDGSDHRWFEDRAPPCTLLVFIDDATSTLMELRFVQSESTFSYFEALESYLQKHGRPVAFYSDKHTVFRVAKEDAKDACADHPVRARAERVKCRDFVCQFEPGERPCRARQSHASGPSGQRATHRRHL